MPPTTPDYKTKWIAEVPDSYKTPGDREFVNSEILAQFADYVLYGEDPGRMLYFALIGDYKHAITSSDDDQAESLRGIAYLIHNRMPGPAQGTAEKVTEWMKHYGMSGGAVWAREFQRLARS